MAELGDVLSFLKENNISTSLNPQYDASGDWAGFDQRVCANLDLLFANEVRYTAQEDAYAAIREQRCFVQPYAYEYA
jgi:hypothetical protein